MQYIAVEPKMPYLLLSCMMLVNFFITNSWMYIFLAILFIISTNVKHHLMINENDLNFTISLFGLGILKRKASKETIKCIEYKRTDWHSKSAFIRLKKGFRWKISRFSPENFDVYIENFAKNNSIEIKKHKNY